MLSTRFGSHFAIKHAAIGALGAGAAAAMSDHEDEPATLHDGYHGWMKSIPKTQRDFTPVRIESAASVEAAPSTQGNSAWNAAGTWCGMQSRASGSADGQTDGRTHQCAHDNREERDKSEWARERLKQLVLESFAFEDGTRKLAVKANSIVRCDGDAKVRRASLLPRSMPCC